MNYRTIALICYANAYLGGRAAVRFPADAWLSAADQFVFRAVVQHAEGESTWEVVATDPDAWFRWLAGSGLKGLRLADSVNADDWRHVWKANGVETVIEAIRPGGESEFWSAIDDFWSADDDANDRVRPAGYWARLIGPLIDIDRNPPAGEHFTTVMLRHVLSVPFLPLTLLSLFRSLVRPRTIGGKGTGWRYVYSRIGYGARSDVAAPDLANAISELTAGVDEARRFANDHRDRLADDFTGRFDRALGVLRGASDLRAEGVNREGRLAPDGILPPEAETILAALPHAWVFGGMMSWNDVYFDGPDGSTIEARYNAVSAKLYVGLMKAVCAAADSSCPRP